MKLRQTSAALASLALAMALAGCGGGSSYGSSASTPPPPVTPPVSMVDAFFSVVASLIGGSAETTEPQAVDNITVTAPDNTEPATPI
ncbi:MAG: hypothetical protein V4634_15400 [Pseudomonadota bacterium]